MIEATQDKNDPNHVKVDRESIRIGMYVTKLDIPWESSNFSFQGFFIATERQVTSLKDQCAYIICLRDRSERGIFPDLPKPKPATPNVESRPAAVYYEDATPEPEPRNFFFPSWMVSIANAPKALAAWINEVFKEIKAYSKPLEPKTAAISTPERKEANLDKAVRTIRINDSIRIFKQFSKENREFHLYTNSVAIQDEVKSALMMKQNLMNALPELVEEMASSAIADQIVFSKEALSEVVASMLRNPDAMQLVSRLSIAEEGSLRRAMDVSLLMISFGREIGLTKSELVDVGIGGLLHDIGSTKVLGGEFNKRRIKTPAEMKVYKEHVGLGMAALDEMHINNPIIRAIVGNHHEKYDATGFPRGIKGNEIGLYGSMAVICEGYVSMVSGHGRYAAITPSAAMSRMIHESGKTYHPTLVQQFIHVVGVYPVGSVVQLNTQEVGVVIGQNRLWRLRPLIRLVIDKTGHRYKSPSTIDLKRSATADVLIVKEIPHGHPEIHANDYLLD